jgi:hypothetical protein
MESGRVSLRALDGLSVDSATSMVHANRDAPRTQRRGTTILLVVLVLALFGALPTWGHSRNWGYGPSGGVGLVLLVLVILFMTGRI